MVNWDKLTPPSPPPKHGLLPAFIVGAILVSTAIMRIELNRRRCLVASPLLQLHKQMGVNPLMDDATRDSGYASAGELVHLLADVVADYGIFFLDQDGLIRTWSTGAERLLSYSEAEILGQPFSLFFTAEEQHDGVPQHEMDQARSTGRGEDDRWHVRKDGTRFWVRQHPEFERTLVVALTGYGTNEDRRKSLHSGCDEHLVKPPGADDLHRMLTHPKLPPSCSGVPV